MPKTTEATTPDEIQQQITHLETQGIALRRRLIADGEETQRRQAAAQREFDEQLVAGYTAAAYETEFTDARAALDQALAQNPLVIALADYLTAMRRRRYAAHEHYSALSRLDRLRGQQPMLPHAELGPVEEILARAVERLTTERTDQENADLHTRRANAGTNPEETR